MLKWTASASKFTVESKSMANILSIDNESYFTLFTARLKTEVQHTLTLIHDIDLFEDLIETAVQIDHINFTLTKADAKVESKPLANKSNS